MALQYGEEGAELLERLRTSYSTIGSLPFTAQIPDVASSGEFASSAPLSTPS